MNSFFHQLIGLLRLRSGPQNLPSSWPLTLLVTGMYFGQGVLTGQQFGEDESGKRVFLSVFTQIILLIAILNFRGMPERFQQSLLALASTGVVLGAIFFGVRMQNDPDVAIQPFWALVIIGLFIWNIAVDANIYKHALSVNMSIGVLVTVAIFAVTYVLDFFLFLPS